VIWYESDNPNGFVTGKRFSVDKPCVTIMAAGMGDDSLGHWHLMEDGRPDVGARAVMQEKPPYRVPSMAEIAALPWNGLTVASTFSGCGGSSLGYRMAGFKVAWANEFIPAAQDTYKANAAADCFLDRRDVRTIRHEEILEQLGMKAGELDLFDGSPPCASFSTAGKREAGWGEAKKYSDTKQRTDDLFFEYIRLLKGLQPRVFIAENVSGLVKGTAKGYFLEILAAMKASGYRVACRVLDAQWLGVPQQRQRTIFIGVRNDLNLDPVHPKPLAYRYSVREALPWIDGRVEYHGFKKENEVMDKGELSPAILASGATQQRSTVEAETDISRYAIGKEWDKLKPGEQSGKYFSLVKPSLDSPVPCIQASHGGASIAGVVHPTEKRKFTIAELRRLCAFPDDFILTGTYAQQWERLGRSVPPVMMSHIAAAVRDGVLNK
jgi:DNA (cytosine-5)-methyltransferase 1